MSNQDSKTEENADSTWSKVVVHEPQNSNQKVTVSDHDDDDDDDSDVESTTETAIIHHSNTGTAIFDEYPQSKISQSPLKVGSVDAMLGAPGHRKQQSSIQSTLDSYVSTGTLQESLKSQLLKLFEEEFKQEFLSKTSQITQLENELKKTSSEKLDLENKYKDLHSNSSQLRKRFENLQKLANKTKQAQQDTLESICKSLNINYIENETVEHLADRIVNNMKNVDESKDSTSNIESNSIVEPNELPSSSSESQFSSVVISLVVGIVIGFILRDKDVIATVVEKFAASNTN